MGSSIRKDFKYASVRANRIAFIESKIWFDHNKNPLRIEDAVTQVHRFMRAMSAIDRPSSKTKAKLAQYWEDDSNRGFFYSRPIQDLIVPILVDRKYAFEMYKNFSRAEITDRIVTAESPNCIAVEFSLKPGSTLYDYMQTHGEMIVARFFALRVCSSPDASDMQRPVRYRMTFTRPICYTNMVTTNISRYREEEEAREAAKLAQPKPPKPAAVNDPSVEVGFVNVASLTRRAVKAVNQTIQEYLERLKMEEAAAETAAKEASAKLVEARRVAEQTRLRHEELRASIKNFQETIVASIKP